MIGLSWDFFAPTPGGAMLGIAVVLTVCGYAALWFVERMAAPPRPDPAGTSGSLRRESPAVVNVLTHDATLTAEGLRATVVDLAARGWLRILPPEDDDEVSRVRPAAIAADGDALLPHERLVQQHILARFTTDRAIPARHLAVDVTGSWWRRFRRLVYAEGRRSGLLRNRWTPQLIAGPVVITLLALLAWLSSRDGGDPSTAVVDSVERRYIAVATLVALLILCYRIGHRLATGQVTMTEAGVAATSRWLTVRQRLVADGFGPMAPSANDIGDRRLGYAAAMGLADGVSVELPMARDDHYLAWSAIGGSGRLVRIRYPFRPGYGLHPVVALIGGLVTVFVAIRLRRFFSDVARGDAWRSLYDRFEEQDWLISDVATGLAVVSFLPIVVGLWVAFAGAADAFNSVERTGVVIRTRRPAEVSPLPRQVMRRLEGDRYSLYVALDDGRSDVITAWRATEKGAMPQDVDAIVRATPVLGYIRKATPIGHVIPE
jgi:Predicted membrane protein (DUF2207) C-terminal domain